MAMGKNHFIFVNLWRHKDLHNIFLMYFFLCHSQWHLYKRMWKDTYIQTCFCTSNVVSHETHIPGFEMQSNETIHVYLSNRSIDFTLIFVFLIILSIGLHCRHCIECLQRREKIISIQVDHRTIGSHIMRIAFNQIGLV